MNNAKPFIIKRNDTLPSLVVNVKTRGDLNQVIPYNLSGVTACTFSMSDDSGNLKVSSQTAQITSYTGGTLQYTWQTGDTDTDGKFNGEFEMFMAAGQKMSIPILGYIEITIVKDINGS